MKAGTAPLRMLARPAGPGFWDSKVVTVGLDCTYLTVFLSRLPVAFFSGAGLRHGFLQKLLGLAPIPVSSSPVIWVHAVSLGEMLMLRPLVRQLMSKRPELQYVLSSRTKEGYAIAALHFPDIPVFYAPFDFSWAVKRVFRRLRPSLLVVAEQDLWMNMLRISARLDVPIAVVNGRMGTDDRKHLQRFNFLPPRAFAKIHLWIVTTEEQIAGVRALAGSDFANIEVAGFLKADTALRASAEHQSPGQLRKLYGFAEEEIIWVAGSTHFPEERILLDAFERLRVDHPSLRLILVPRNEPFSVVERLLVSRNIEFVKRSQMTGMLRGSCPVMLVDRFGELPALWKLADVAFVGGSLLPRWQGHNVLEPAAAGVPTCFGPHVSTFEDLAQALIHAGGAVHVETAADIYKVVGRWLADPALANRTGTNARSFVIAQRGATARTVTALDRVLPLARSVPRVAAV